MKFNWLLLFFQPRICESFCLPVIIFTIVDVLEKNSLKPTTAPIVQDKEGIIITCRPFRSQPVVAKHVNITLLNKLYVEREQGITGLLMNQAYPILCEINCVMRGTSSENTMVMQSVYENVFCPKNKQ